MDHCIWKQCIQKSNQPWYFTVNCETLYHSNEENQITEMLYLHTQQSLSQFLCKLIMTQSLATKHQNQLTLGLKDIDTKKNQLDQLIAKSNNDDVIVMIQEMNSLMEFIKPLVLNINYGYTDYLDHQISIAKADASVMRYLYILKQTQIFIINQQRMLEEKSLKQNSSIRNSKNFNSKTGKNIMLEYLTLQQKPENQTQTSQVMELLSSCQSPLEHRQYKEFREQEIYQSKADIIIFNLEEVPSFLFNTQGELKCSQKIILVTRIQFNKQSKILILDPDQSLKKDNKKKIMDKISSLSDDIPPLQKGNVIPPDQMPKMQQIKQTHQIAETRQEISTNKNNFVENFQCPKFQKRIIIYLLTTLKQYDMIKALKESLIFIQKVSDPNIINVQNWLIEVKLLRHDEQIDKQQPYGIIYTSEQQQQAFQLQGSIQSLRIIMDQSQNQDNFLQLRYLNSQDTEFNMNVSFILKNYIQHQILSKVPEQYISEYNNQPEWINSQQKNTKILLLGYASQSELRQLSECIKSKLNIPNDSDIQFLHKNISHYQEQYEINKLYNTFEPSNFKCLMYLPCWQTSKLQEWMIRENRSFVFITSSINREIFDKHQIHTIYLKPQQLYEVESINIHIQDYLTKQ